MNAMTWFDHGTQSIWSQPWGKAIADMLKGSTLEQIPSSVVPWATWLETHPDTTVVGDDLGRAAGFNGVNAHDEFVIGVSLGEFATAYPYRVASAERVINDRLGDRPLVVFVDPDTRDIHVYVRSTGFGADQDALTFEIDRTGRIVDNGTASVWDPVRGVATEGALKGTTLQQVPFITSFDWAWLDFYPHSSTYSGDGAS